MLEEEVDPDARDGDSDGTDSRKQEQDAVDQGPFPKTSLVLSYQPTDAGEEISQPQQANNINTSYFQDTEDHDGETLAYWNKAAVVRNGFQIRAPPAKEPWEYIVYTSPKVSKVLQEYDDEGDVSYLVSFTDDRVEEVSNGSCSHSVLHNGILIFML